MGMFDIDPVTPESMHVSICFFTINLLDVYLLKNNGDMKVENFSCESDGRDLVDPLLSFILCLLNKEFTMEIN